MSAGLWELVLMSQLTPEQQAPILRGINELTASNVRMREALERRGCRFAIKTDDCDCYVCKALAESPTQSLAAIQDAARAEERERCAKIADEFTAWPFAREISGAIRNRDDEEAK